VITVMATPEEADLDKSKHLSPSEAALLGLALSVDNVVAVTAASLGGLIPSYTPVAMGLVQTALFAAGCYGAVLLVADRIKRRLRYASGAVLVVLGIVRLV
jgi:putative Mn2+ efflux pump MntP